MAATTTASRRKTPHQKKVEAYKDEPWRQAWLEDFFRDEPVWRERLWAWIRELGADETSSRR